MASANYVLLEKITVGAAGASSVTFSGIPQTGYTDLVVKVSARNTYSAVSDWINVQFNSSTTGYSYRLLQGNGTSANSYSGSTQYSGDIDGATATASTFGSYEMYIPNYTSANNKSYSVDAVIETNATNAESDLLAGLWSNSAAITGITFSPRNGSFVQFSTFYLYGVAKLGTTPAIVPYATGGDTIMTDGTYWYHTFISSGTFTPQKAISCDYLVVAGGGGGARGGGGAGGYKTASALLLDPNTAYTVTVGAGGAGGSSAQGTNGSNSVFATITSTGGGGGGGTESGVAVGANGGSGGGGGFNSTSTSITISGGSATPSGQGNAGGTGRYGGTEVSAGGGGGAGAVGGDHSPTSGTPTNSGNGGVGLQSSLSGTATFYAGGGGGGGRSVTAGTGGNGGGGAGSVTTIGTAGTANRGGGGGGSNLANIGAAGGSGLVIVRYAV